MPVPPEGQRQRRWAPKTRTGCKTCKIRRKKCDEHKPHCLRCIKDKFPCDGYESPKTWAFTPSPEMKGQSPTQPYVRPICLISPIEDDDSPEAQCLAACQPIGYSDAEALVRSSSVNSDFLLEPSSPWTSSIDQDYTQYFLQRTAPLLSSTRRWQNFWQRIVPQAAWSNPAIRHAMIAVTLTFDSHVTGSDHSALILNNRKRAVQAFANEPVSSWEVGLIFCRLFSTMAQCLGDFRGAMAHMKSGARMLREAGRNGLNYSSDIVRLMAATFMGLFADSTVDFDVIKRFPPRERKTFRVLQKMCSEYARLLRRITNLHYPDWVGRHPQEWSCNIEKATMGFLSVVFTTLNQAISSAMYPDLLAFDNDDGIVPVKEVHEKLLERNQLMSFEELKDMYRPLFDDVQAYFDKPKYGWDEFRGGWHLPVTNKYRLPVSLEVRLKHFVENYLVHALELEPRMTAGTFWLPYAEIPQCLMEEVFDAHWASIEAGVASCLHMTYHNDCGHEGDHPTFRQRMEYYHEYVCEYRSGFML